MQNGGIVFLGSVPTSNEWAKRAMSYIGIKVRLIEQAVILDPDSQGRITLRFGARTVTLPQAVTSLLEEGQNRIVVNLANVNFLDAAGLREFVSTLHTVKDLGGEMKVVQLTPRLAELMTTGKVLPLFDVYENESEAVASF
jgi:anti-sigma B factor antagonist